MTNAHVSEELFADLSGNLPPDRLVESMGE